MKKMNIIVSIAVVVAAILAGVYLEHRKVSAPTLSDSSQAGSTDVDGNKAFDLTCDDGKTISLTFNLPDDKSVNAVLSDGRTLSLANSSSPDGDSYTSSDGTIVLSLDGANLNLTENGTVTYANCSLAGSDAPDPDAQQ